MSAFIEFIDVKKTFGKTHALNGVSLTMNRQEEYVIRGASGTGKSTMLYLLGGLDRPTSGKIKVDGKDLSLFSDEELAQFRNKSVGFVFQFHFLLPNLTGLENILLPSQIGKMENSKLVQEVKELADRLGVAECLDKHPYELSGGEQQRINIIRALSLRPKLLLCDEPTGNLDSENSAKVVKTIRALAKEFQATLIVVTHDEDISRSFQHHFYLKDGRLNYQQ